MTPGVLKQQHRDVQHANFRYDYPGITSLESCWPSRTAFTFESILGARRYIIMTKIVTFTGGRTCINWLESELHCSTAQCTHYIRI